MNRFACTFLLVLCCPVALAAQQKVGSGRAVEEAGTVVVPAPPPAPGDTALDDEPLIERAVGGAIVGAVTGGVLNAQDSDCAPSESPARASFFGAVFGAIRGALKWDSSDDLPLPDTRDNGGEEGPYPFDGQMCEREDG